MTTAAAAATPARRVPLLRRWLTARGRSLEITKAGWLFIVLTLAVGFAAINSGSNLLHAIFGMQMALIIGSGILSEAMVRRIAARRIPSGDLYAHTRAAVRVEVRNTDPRRDTLSVSVEDDDRVASPNECAPVFCVRVAGGQTLTMPSTMVMGPRGRSKLPAAVVATRFPFGLFIKRRDLPASREVIVYPRVRPVPAHEGHSARPGDGEASGRIARSGEYHGLREYRPGDELRRVHWPAVARLQRPVVREHEALGDREIMLELRPGTTGDPAFEKDVERVASLAVAHLGRSGVAVGLREGGHEVVALGTGRDHSRRLLRYLALCGAAPKEAP